MGHCINYHSFPVETPKKDIQEAMNCEAAYDHSSLDKAIRFYDDVLPNYDEAKKFIQNHDSGWYDQLAVQYLDLPQGFSSKTLDALDAKLGEASKALRAAVDTVTVIQVKAQYIGCKSCGSKLNKKFLKSNFCPICHADMRSETQLQKIQRLQDKVDALTAQYSEERKKLAKKHGVRKWLVKIEYHI